MAERPAGGPLCSPQAPPSAPGGPGDRKQPPGPRGKLLDKCPLFLCPLPPSNGAGVYVSSIGLKELASVFHLVSRRALGGRG